MEAEDGGLAIYQGHLPFRWHPTACDPRMATEAVGREGVQSPLFTSGGVQEGLTLFPLPREDDFSLWPLQSKPCIYRQEPELGQQASL